MFYPLNYQGGGFTRLMCCRSAILPYGGVRFEFAALRSKRREASGERIAASMLAYFRELMPILLPLITHPSFDYEDFVKRHPESPLTRVREGLMEYLERQAETGKVRPENIRASGLTLVATMHSLALFERMGVHGGHCDEQMVKGIV